MAFKIVVRRGLSATLGEVVLDQGELGFTTDTGEVYVGDGTSNVMVSKVKVGLLASRPAAGVSGRIYEATDEGKTYLDTGSAWKLVGVASIDDIPDGTTYARVLASEIYLARIKQIRAETAALDVTGDQLNSHLTNDAAHRVINDAGVAITDLWSAEKIETTKADLVAGAIAGHIASLDALGNLFDSGLVKNDLAEDVNSLWSANKILNAIHASASGLSWQDSVVAINMITDASQGGTPPTASEGQSFIASNWGAGYTDGVIYEYDGSAFVAIGALTAGTRVITVNGATGSFLGHDKQIAEYDGSTWAFYSPFDGWAVLVTGDGSIYENAGYLFSGSKWIKFTGLSMISAGIGLAKSGNTLDVRMGAGIGQLPTDEIGIDLVSGGGLKLTSTKTRGQLTVDYDAVTLGIKNNQLSILDGGVTGTQLNASAAGDGLTGGGGSALAVGGSDAIDAGADVVSLIVNSIKGLALDASGISANPDLTTINFVNGELSCAVLDGGTFSELPYSPPAGDDVDIYFSGLSTYTPPAGDSVDIEF